MSLLKDPSVVAILCSVADKLNIPRSDVDFHLAKGADKGDGYLSQMSLVQINSKRNPAHKINLVLKCAHREPDQRRTFPLHQLYLREVRFYEEVMPAFLVFQAKYNIPEPFIAVPKYFASSVGDRNEFLVMENLKMAGFELWDRTLPLDGEHAELVLKNYAKFHAVSFAIRQHDPQLYQKLCKGLNNLLAPSHVDRGFFESMEKAMDKAITLFSNGNEADQKYCDKLVAFRNAGKLIDFFGVTEQDAWENPVITHGDGWLNNFMFKYSRKYGEKQLEDVKIIDFQIMRHVSPILDIAKLVYMNTDACFYNNYEHFLGYYYEHLVEHGKLMDTDVKHLFSYETLKREWAKYGIYGLFYGLIGVGILLQDKNGIVDLSDVSNGKTTAADVFFIDNNTEEGVRRMKNLIIDFVDNNFL